MRPTYDSPEQEALHLNAIKSLAAETGRDFDLVRQVYQAELARLQSGARLSEYVLLLSSRRTRETLSKPAQLQRPQALTA